MDLKTILSPNCVLHKIHCSSKKRILETIASHLCDQHPALDPGNVFSALIAREKLGSTGLGNGIAIPHCRIQGCSNTIGVLVTLDKPIDFDAIDSQPVDVIFVLIVPDNQDKDHLQTLSALAQVFSNTEHLSAIRQANNADELYHQATRQPVV